MSMRILAAAFSLIVLFAAVAPAVPAQSGPGSDSDRLRSDCDADEAFNASTEKCEDVPTDEDEPESDDLDKEADAEKDHDADSDEVEPDDETEKDSSGSGSADDQDLQRRCERGWYNTTSARCEPFSTMPPDKRPRPQCPEGSRFAPDERRCVRERPTCDRDEVYVVERDVCVDREEFAGQCKRKVDESESSRIFPNGTRRIEVVRVVVVDCPGHEHDRRQADRKVFWRERVRDVHDDRDDKQPRDRPHRPDRVEVRIERGDDVKAVVKVPRVAAERGFNLSMAKNASELSLRETDESAPTLRVDFLDIIEFVDLNGNGGFDLDDLQVNSWRVADLEANATSSDDENVTIRYGLPPGGSVSFIHRALDSDRLKFDIVFEGFVYATPTSQLALRTSFIAKTAEYRTDLEHPALVALTPDGRLASFDWIEMVDADGTDVPVVATVYVGDGAATGTAQLFLSYPRAASIVHDPSVGFLTVQSIAVVKDVLVHPGTYIVAALAAAVFVATGFVGRRKP